MGILTRYLDLLPPDARTRVLTAGRWTTRWHVADDGARNLMGHAEDWSRTEGQIGTCGAPEVFRLRATAGDDLWTDESCIGRRFDRLVERCGMARAIELIHAHLRRNAHT